MRDAEYHLGSTKANSHNLQSRFYEFAQSSMKTCMPTANPSVSPFGLPAPLSGELWGRLKMIERNRYGI